MFTWKENDHVEGRDQGYAGSFINDKADEIFLFLDPKQEYYTLVWATAGLRQRDCLASINLFTAAIEVPFPKDKGLMVFMNPSRQGQSSGRKEDFVSDEVVALPLDTSAATICGVSVDLLKGFRIDIPRSLEAKTPVSGTSIVVLFTEGSIGTKGDQEVQLAMHKSLIPTKAMIDFYVQTTKHNLGAGERSSLAALLTEKVVQP